MTVQNLNAYDHMYRAETTVDGVDDYALSELPHFKFGKANYHFADDFIFQLKERLGTITVQEKEWFKATTIHNNELKALKDQYTQNLEDLKEYKKQIYEEIHAQIFNNHVCQVCKKEILK